MYTVVWGADPGMAEPGQTALVKRVRELDREGWPSGKDLGQHWSGTGRGIRVNKYWKVQNYLPQ